jgi:hypothetical protein
MINRGYGYNMSVLGESIRVVNVMRYLSNTFIHT